MRPKRAFFFKDNRFVEYAPRSDVVDLTRFPADIASAWVGLAGEGFDSGIDAVLNAGNGFIYFFKGDSYIRFNPREKRVDVPKTLISTGWPKLVPTGFDHDLDAAVYYRDGKVLFFKGSKYLRYNIADDTVETGYPKEIRVGWSNIGWPFTDGIDAAVNWGEGKAYFFRGGKYVRITIKTNAVDHGYPLDTAEQWTALPVAFTDKLSGAVEWPYCEVELFDVSLAPGGCVPFQVNPGGLFPQMRVQHLFAVVARFSAPEHPADCRSGEYRQLIRGDHILDGQRISPTLADGTSTLPRPAPGALDDNFREDSTPRTTPGANLHYGHRDELPGNLDPTDRYEPERATGCTYRGFDFPFIDGRPGQTFVLDLDFRGVLIDVCNDNEEMRRNDWHVFCHGTF